MFNSSLKKPKRSLNSYMIFVREVRYKPNFVDETNDR